MHEFVRFAVLLTAGLVSAASIGKIVPHLQWMVSTYDITLGAAGLIVSAVMIPGALLGTAIGPLSDRVGAKPVVLVGLALHAAASAGTFLGGSFWTLLAVRLVEGAGYLLFVVAATVLIVEQASVRRRGLALAVWSAFAPVGFALGQWGAAGVDGSQRLAQIGVVHAMFLIAVLALVAALIPRADRKTGTALGGGLFAGARHPPALRAALSFGFSTGVLLAAVALAPLVLAPAYGLSVTETAKLTAIAALPGILGRFGSGWLLGLGLTPRVVFGAAAVVGTACLFVSLHAPVGLYVALVFFSGFQIAAGAMPGVLSAMIPVVARDPREIGAVSGVINQMVNIGNLFGPPVALAVFAAAGAWTANGMLVVAILFATALVIGLQVFGRTARQG